MSKQEMSFLEHLGELRGHLLRSVVVAVAMAILIGSQIDWVVEHILFYPIKPDFPTFKIINEFTLKYFGEESFALPEKFPIQVRRLYEQFNVTISIAVFGGLLCSFPYIIWELWRFISPALLPNEKKYSLIIINGTWGLFFLGALCGYFIILPFAINFGYFYRISDSIQLSYDLSDYLSIFLQITFGMAFVFLFPMIVYFLSMLGVISPKTLQTYRKHALILILIISAFITPSDVISMFVAAVPLLILYEMSILLTKIIHRKT
ncbi:MAG: twin-arginine translocase subunit TatC [Flavobacteriaceae bacterium]|nr:twin-arginine translocase subunit TatC [Flavobacteriaceae bacterium]